MDGDSGTASLRVAASNWNLAGDKNLLEVLQGIHQRLVSRCQETNSQLEVLAADLDMASVSLHNVNNRFIGLSSSQFVESRVQEDDFGAEPPPKAPLKPPEKEARSELERFRDALAALESRHEPVRIFHSDSDDSDAEAEAEADCSLLLRPKPRYASRPLPHVIGSAAWRKTWHAGLILSESESESESSSGESFALKRRRSDASQYSESASEEEEDEEREEQGSLVTPSLVEVPPPAPPALPSPAQVAAEIARRMAGHSLPPRSHEPEPLEPPKPQYRPHLPSVGTVFCDVPPPLSAEAGASSDEDIVAVAESDEDEDDDIFAELRKGKALGKQKKANDSLTDQLFGQEKSSSAKEPSLFDEGSQNVFLEKSSSQLKATSNDNNSKKPIGGISLFGTNADAQNIGADILKRNIKQSNVVKDKTIDSSNTNEKDVARINKDIESDVTSKEKDMLEDLFSKSIKTQNKKISNSKQTKVEVPKPAVEKSPLKKIDLFDDNIFDDLDDIFTKPSNASSTKKDNQKILFDDKDLFSEGPIPKQKDKTNKRVDIKTKGLFDSDDELPDEVVKENNDKPKVFSTIKKIEPSSILNNQNKSALGLNKDSKSIFDSDSDDGRIFNTVKDNNDSIMKAKNVIKNDSEPLKSSTVNKITTSNLENRKLPFDDEDLFSGGSIPDQEIKTNKSIDIKSKGIFDSDDESPNEENPKSEVEPKKELESSSKLNIQNNRSLNKTESVINKPLDSSIVIITTSLNSDTKETLKEPNNVPVINNDLPSKETFENVKNSSLFESNDEDALFDPNAKSENKSNEDNKVLIKTSKIISDHESIPNNEFLEQTKIVDNQKENSNKIFDIENDELFSKPKDEAVVSTVKELNKTLTSDDSSTYQQSNVKVQEQPDIFTDVFIDAPPVLVESKDPKKSKNVNALFDDDSDDEALFFKKSDATLDEKPEIFPKNEQNRIFGLFDDEPPDIDVDFTQKTNKNESTQKSEVFDPSDNLFNKTETNQNVEIKKSILKDTFPKLEESFDNTDGDTQPDEGEVKKKIGKLKPLNLNINVNSLLPGASPKKQQKSDEQTDGQIFTRDTEVVETNPKIDTKKDPALPKAVFFEKDPVSSVLDNKLSKDRAKIQVKRRPSTRSARKEAVRKSAIEIGDDTTDNSSYIDDNPKSEHNKPEISDSNTDTDVQSTNTKDVKSKIVYVLNDEDIFTNSTENKKLTEQIKTIHTDDFTDDSKLVETHADETVSPQINTLGKVYSDVQKPELKSTRMFNEDSDDDDLFTSSKKTVGKSATQSKPDVTKNTDGKENKDMKSIFGGLSDDEDDKLFNKTKTDHAKVTQKSIFGSDSEDELFMGKTKKKSEVTVKKRREVDTKKPLFGDESDDDDLFAVKTKKATDSRPQKTSSAANLPKSVFEDPLSMLDED